MFVKSTDSMLNDPYHIDINRESVTMDISSVVVYDVRYGK